jgi:hypothetical protein
MDKMVVMRIHLAGVSERSGPSSFRGEGVLCAPRKDRLAMSATYEISC